MHFQILQTGDTCKKKKKMIMYLQWITVNKYMTGFFINVTQI